MQFVYMIVMLKNSKGNTIIQTNSQLFKKIDYTLNVHHSLVDLKLFVANYFCLWEPAPNIYTSRLYHWYLRVLSSNINKNDNIQESDRKTNLINISTIYLSVSGFWAGSLNTTSVSASKSTSTADSTAAKKILIFKSFSESPVNHL